MKALLLGATGMLGSAFANALGSQAVPVPRAALDVRDFSAFVNLLEATIPNVVINCAAHVDADAVEFDPDPAYIANAMLPGLLAVHCRQHNIPLVQFSSTGCYGAWKSEPYSDEDRLEPTTVHHRSKQSGENQVREAGGEHLILRVGWLFGGTVEHKKNFVWRRLLEATGANQLTSDQSQHGCPTFVDDVVDQTMFLLNRRIRGTFNCVSQGKATRFDYVERIVKAAGLPCELVPSGAFKRLAPVSPNETAINYRLGLLGLDQMPDWTVSLDRYVSRVLKWPAYRDRTSAGGCSFD